MRVEAQLFLLSLILIGISNAATITPAASTPALIWGSEKFFGEKYTNVNYQTLALSDVWNALADSWLLGETKENDVITTLGAPELLVLFAGSQIDLHDLNALKSTPVMKPLSKALAQSPSTLLLPNVMSEGEKMEFATAVKDKKSLNVQVAGTCAADAADADVTAVMERTLSASETAKDGKPTVIVVCSSNTLVDEMADLERVTNALGEWSGPHAFMYVSYDAIKALDEESLKAHQRHLLIKVPPEYAKCDDLCMTQVKFLEAIILAMILSLALAAGLCCTHIVDGPSQFEKPPEES